MKTIIIYILISLLSFTVLAQSQKDSLVRVSKIKTDADLLSVYFDILNLSSTYPPDTLSYYAKKALALAESLDSTRAQLNMKNFIAIAHYRKSEYKKAISIWENMLLLATQQQDTVIIGNSYNNIGLSYKYMAKYGMAVEYLQKSLKIRLASNDPKVSSCYNNLGIVYEQLFELDKALEYQKKGLALKLKRKESLSLANSYNNIGIILKKQEKYDSAIHYYEQSLRLARKLNGKSKISFALNNLASLYSVIGDDVNSELYYLESLQIKKEMNDNIGLMNTYNNLCNIYSKQKKYKKAQFAINKSDSLSAIIGKSMFTIKNYFSHILLLEGQEKYKDASEYRVKVYNLKVELLDEERNQKMTTLETQFDLEMKEAEIEKLNLDKQWSDSKLTEARLQIWILLLGLTFIMTTAILVFYFQKKKQKVEKNAQKLQFEALQIRYINILNQNDSAFLDVNKEALNKMLVNPLTEREYEILQMSFQGKTNQEIADQAFISLSTVKFHLNHVYNKFGVNNKKEALQYVVKTS